MWATFSEGVSFFFATGDIFFCNGCHFFAQVPFFFAHQCINKSVYSKIMRENLSMSYKKENSCISGIQKDRMDLLKCLFTIRIISHLSEFEMLINIDESSFSRTTKQTHSYLKKGKAWKLGNIWSSSSTSLITVITSKGNVFAANTKELVNSSMFLEFMAKLRTFIRGSYNIQKHRCLFILDNASTHCSAKVVEYWKQYSLSVAFIPSYMPELHRSRNISLSSKIQF